jgi:hypothetical protein
MSGKSSIQPPKIHEHFGFQQIARLDAGPEIKLCVDEQILIMLSDLCAGGSGMVDVSEITLEKLSLFSDRFNVLVTIDAPLYGSVMIFNGRVLHRGGSYVEPEKIGNALGFPTYDHIVAEASRFWILDESGVRRVKCREEMAELLQQLQSRATRVSTTKPASVQSAANG